MWIKCQTGISPFKQPTYASLHTGFIMKGVSNYSAQCSLKNGMCVFACIFKEVQKSDGEADGLGMGMSVAQAKERAQQKRAVKKAPTMDWKKRNELFSSL